MRRSPAGLIVVTLLACGGGRPPPTPPPALDDESGEEGPRIAGVALPRLPIDVSPEDAPLAEGWERTARALTMPTPRPPIGEAWEVETWADEELADWMRRRAEAISSAQRALSTAREGAPRYSVVASHLLGLAYTRFAMELRGIPTPVAFAEDEGRTRAFRDALEAAAGPLWLRALDAYGSCSSVAGAQPAHSLDRWREACDREIRVVSRMLPDDDHDEDDDESDD